ncbi:MAG: MerR family transcriptional regulator [Clostridiaceae bacterium]|nr:MerR family transcriptional regulator [Clostridiaceae bacterium]
MKTYKTAEIARRIGIHPNTVRLYEELGFISRPERRPNGYRVFTDLHVEQFQFARTALKIEVLQNGLRKMAVDMIKISAAGDFDRAASLTEDYLQQLKNEQANAEEALFIARQLLSGGVPEPGLRFYTRKEAADLLHITPDALRNWEMNGLLAVRRKQNGYRIYTGEDIRLLKIIRALRCANYSLTAILRMLSALSRDPQADIRTAIDTPGNNEEIISVCDKLLTSLRHAEQNAQQMRSHLLQMKKKYSANPPL